MDKIPQELVKSLIKLGLLESEAKIYIALAMMNNSEVKKLIDFLGLSKPNTYESLRMLEEKGLVFLINTRPMTYQAVSPDIGLEMLLKTHLDAKKEAQKLFSTMDKEKFIEKSSEPLWHVFSGKSIEYKIKDMIHSATKSIFWVSSPQYLKYLDKLNEKNLKLDIIIFSDSYDTEQKLKELFKDKKGNFQIISEEDMVNAVISPKIAKEELLYYKEALKMDEYKYMMVLMVDDLEVLYIPLLPENSLAAINTKSKGMIMLVKMAFKDITFPLLK